MSKICWVDAGCGGMVGVKSGVGWVCDQVRPAGCLRFRRGGGSVGAAGVGVGVSSAMAASRHSLALARSSARSCSLGVMLVECAPKKGSSCVSEA